MSNNHDKRELLKLKQGLIEDSEVIKREEPVKIELHGKKKAEHFWYYNKVKIYLILFFGAILSLFIYEMLSVKKADIEFLLLASNRQTSTVLFNHVAGINEAVGAFTPNFDGNKYIYAEGFAIDLFNAIDRNSYMAAQTRLFTEVRSGLTRLVIGNRDAFEVILGDSEYDLNGIFVDLSERYPANENIIEEVFFKLADSEFPKLAGIDEADFPEDLYLALLAVNLSNDRQKREHENALIVLDNIVSNKIINPAE
jgi:hypothetical protein